MILTNSQIYSLAIKCNIFYENKINLFPVTTGFYLFKNFKILKDYAKEIDDIKSSIVKEFAIEYDEEKQSFTIAKDKQQLAQDKMDELSMIEQDVPLYPLYLDDFKDVKLNSEELQVLINIIQEEKKEDD